MTSKVQPAENYWTDDVKSAACCRLLNRWPRKPGDKVVLFWWAEKQRAKWRNSFKNVKIFWLNSKAIIEFGFRRMGRHIQIQIQYNFTTLATQQTLVSRWGVGKHITIKYICCIYIHLKYKVYSKESVRSSRRHGKRRGKFVFEIRKRLWGLSLERLFQSIAPLH